MTNFENFILIILVVSGTISNFCISYLSNNVLKLENRIERLERK
jgi:outer membrane murein-binding lipoprotein Lpp